MGLDAVNKNSIKEKIHELAKTYGATGRKQIETCNAIAEEAKELIEDLNADEKAIYEIAEDITESFEELEELQKQQAEAEAKICTNESKINYANKRLADLDKKKESGKELTKAEQKEYGDLTKLIAAYSDSTNKENANIKELGAKVETLGAQVYNNNTQLQDIADKMDGYKEAGKEIEAASKKYGKNGNAEGVLKRNSKSWWSWLGIGKNQLKEKYQDKLDLEDLGDQKTFYDDVDHTFISQYDAIEAKGKNQIIGKWRNATAKVFSYGRTIQQASDKVKKDAEENQKETDYKPKTEE